MFPARLPSAVQHATSRWVEAMQGQGQAWLFIAKTLLAFYLAGWVCMRLEMPSPFTAMVTVLVVATPQPGGVLSKGFYRATGTIAGCLVGLLLIGLFPQQPVLLMLSMSIWVGLMAAGSLLNRGTRAYSFVLSGYGVSMIVLPSLNQPHAVFDAALWRLAEVGMAVIITCCVFDIITPKRLRAPVMASTKQNADQLLRWIIRSSRTACLTAVPEQQDLVRAAVAYEDLRGLAYFDDPALRRSHGLLGTLNQRYMSVLSAYTSLLHLRERAQRQQSASAQLIEQALHSLADQLEPNLASSSPEQVYVQLQRWQAALPLLSSAGNEADELAIGRIQHVAEELLRYWQLYQQLNIDKTHHTERSLRRSPTFWRVIDPVAVALALLRAGCLTFAVGLLWMLSGWQPGSSGVFMVIALLSILAAAPYPLEAFRLIAIVQLCAPVLGLLCSSVLPLMNEFIWLVLATLPCMLAMLYLVTRPKWAAAAMSMIMSFMVVVMISPAPRLDGEWLVNDVVAVLLGIALVGLSFVLFPSVTHSRGQRKRLFAMLRAQVGKAVQVPLAHAGSRLASEQYDLLSQLFAMNRADGPAAKRLLQWAQLTHEASSALLSLRRLMVSEATTPQMQQHWQQLSRSVGLLYQKPSQKHWLTASSALEQALAISVEPHWRQPLLQLKDLLNDGAHVLTRHTSRFAKRSA